MTKISFEAKPYKIGDWTVLHLPKDASAKLPSRGMTMVEGTLNGHSFKAALEPDGRGSHWFRLTTSLQKTANTKAGDIVMLEIEPAKEWWRPEAPEDLKKALAKTPQAGDLWNKITPNAQWEWIRWIRATKQEETRKRRIEVAISKLKSGMRRPCCFNRNLCSEPYVSHNWMLLEPATADK
jgi:hypothetical protein